MKLCILFVSLVSLVAASDSSSLRVSSQSDVFINADKILGSNSFGQICDTVNSDLQGHGLAPINLRKTITDFKLGRPTLEKCTHTVYDKDDHVINVTWENNALCLNYKDNTASATWRRFNGRDLVDGSVGKPIQFVAHPNKGFIETLTRHQFYKQFLKSIEDLVKRSRSSPIDIGHALTRATQGNFADDQILVATESPNIVRMCSNQVDIMVGFWLSGLSVLFKTQGSPSPFLYYIQSKDFDMDSPTEESSETPDSFHDDITNILNHNSLQGVLVELVSNIMSLVGSQFYRYLPPDQAQEWTNSSKGIICGEKNSGHKKMLISPEDFIEYFKDVLKASSVSGPVQCHPYDDYSIDAVRNEGFSIGYVSLPNRLLAKFGVINGELVCHLPNKDLTIRATKGNLVYPDSIKLYIGKEYSRIVATTLEGADYDLLVLRVMDLSIPDLDLANLKAVLQDAPKQAQNGPQVVAIRHSGQGRNIVAVNFPSGHSIHLLRNATDSLQVSVFDDRDQLCFDFILAF